MSRFTIDIPQEKEGNFAAYGFDHATGYFFQVFGQPVNGVETLLVDECSMFSNMSNGRMVELMKEYGADEGHVMNAVLDLPF